MDVMPMATMPVAVDRVAASPPAHVGGPGGFGAALDAARAGEGSATTGLAPAATGMRTEGPSGDASGAKPGASAARFGDGDAPNDPASVDDLQASLAGALGLQGAVLRNQAPVGLSGLAGRAPGSVSSALPAGVKLSNLLGASLTPLATPALRGLQAGLAAQGFASLQQTLQGPTLDGSARAAAGGGAGGEDALAALQVGLRQSGLTQELAHLLAQRQGPLPDFGAPETGEAGRPGQASPPADPSGRETAGLAPFVAPPPPERSGDRRLDHGDRHAPTVASDETPAAAPSQIERPVNAATAGEGPNAHADATRAAVERGAAGILTPTANSSAPAAPVPTLLAGHLAPNTGLPPGVEAPAILRQLGDGLKLMTQGARQSAEIQLSPAELGKVKVRMEIEGQAVRMFVTTENAAVRDLVAQGLDGLRRDLMAQGLQCQHMSVNVQADTRGSGREKRDDDPNRDDAMAEVPGDDFEFAARTVPSNRRTRSDGSRIDLTV